MRDSRCSSENGTALLVALVTVLLVTMSLLVAASLVQIRADTYLFEDRRVVATLLADAALAEALARLDDDEKFSGARDRHFGSGVISSIVEPVGSDGRKVVAVGRVAGFQTSITADVELVFGRPRVKRWRYRSGSAP